MTAAVVTFRVEDRKQFEETVKASGAKNRSEFIRGLLEGVWIAYDPETRGAVPYSTEVDARRATEGTKMQVKYVKFGEGI